jgi:hypothetical protein
MRWNCFEDELYVGDWRVEGNDNEGRVYVAIFLRPRRSPSTGRYHLHVVVSGHADSLRDSLCSSIQYGRAACMSAR